MDYSNCLVTASKRALYIPVVNLSNQALQWNEGNALATVELLCTSVIPLNTANDGDSVCSVTVSSSSPPIPDEIKRNLVVGENVTTEERERLFELLDRHSDSFVDKKSVPIMELNIA